MKMRSNIHTHSTWCDGKSAPRDVARRAVELGFSGLGFSSHSPTPFDRGCPGLASEEAYRADIRALAGEFCGVLDIWCGIETDYFAPAQGGASYDYRIGSVHYLPAGGGYASVDAAPERLAGYVQDYCGGSWLEMARRYYGLCVDMVKRDRPDVLGHFDLITKFNEGNAQFDEGNPRYRAVALEAMDAILDEMAAYGGVAEVNTGAMSRGWRSRPYPAPFILRHLKQRGALLVITTDSHAAETLDFGFEQALAALGEAGFEQMLVMEKGRLLPVEIGG